MDKNTEKKDLAQEFSDSSRSVARVGNEFYVPEKFDSAGNPLDSDSFDPRKHLKRLSLNDLRFLKVWRDSGWNTEKAIEAAQVTPGHAERLVRKLSVFREEDARVKALAEVPTASWIAAKHVENVYEGGVLEDSERDSLKELAKISGAYKTAATVNIQHNVFNLPKLSVEAMEKLKEFADGQANVIEGEIAA